MTREEIIQVTLKEGRVKKTVDHWMRNAPWELRKDMVQEIWLILCEYPEEKLLDIYRNGLMNAFVTRIIRNSWWTTRSVFKNKYYRQMPTAEEEMPLEPTLPDESPDDDRVWIIKEVLRKLPKEEKRVWDVYLKTGEYKETAERVNLNPWQVKYMVNGIRKKVKKVLKEYDAE